jgi:hypothetical protein
MSVLYVAALAIELCILKAWMKEHTLPNRLDANILDCAERLQVPILRIAQQPSPQDGAIVFVFFTTLAPGVALLLRRRERAAGKRERGSGGPNKQQPDITNE